MGCRALPALHPICRDSVMLDPVNIYNDRDNGDEFAYK
jgi:hypothetical protein